MKLLHFFASLKLTVVLFALSMFLIFAGTLQQVHAGVWQTVHGTFRSGFAWLDLGMFIPKGMGHFSLNFPFPGGGVLAGLLLLNLLAAHAVRFKVTVKRLGIIILHAGLILLLLGEFVTGWFAEEGIMAIDEGSQSNYIEDIRETEFAVVDSTTPGRDHVIAFPQSKVKRAASTKESLIHSELPFSISIDEWMPNSSVAAASGPTRATQGIGLQISAAPTTQVSGIDGNQVDTPSAYITLRTANEAIGTWLVSASLGAPQSIQVGGKNYFLWLRFKRTYKPYTIQLIDFKHDKFTGTEVARNFSSRVRLVDPTRGTDREALIYMNHPLRYAGETFYQASFKPDDSGTVLQVVRNPGWLLPYLSCALVGAGMVIHFGMMLWRSGPLSHRPAASSVESEMVRGDERIDVDSLNNMAPSVGPHPGPLPKGEGENAGARWLPWVTAIVGIVLALGGIFRREAKSAFDIQAFASLPVSADGRVKPLETVGRNTLMMAGGKATVRTADQTISAGTFLLDLIARPEVGQKYPVLRIDHPDLLALLDRTPEQAGRFSLADVQPHWAKITQQVQRVAAIPVRQRDPFERAVMQLSDRVNKLLDLSQLRAPYPIPPLSAGQEWQSFHQTFLDSRDPRDMHPAMKHLVAIMTAYHEQKAEEFNRAVAQYDDLLRNTLPRDRAKMHVEVLFNRAAPFYGATIVYVLAFLTGCVALMGKFRSSAPSNFAARARQITMGLLIAALIVQTVGIALRIYLQGRPPVTNLYSSAVFVGWACVLMAILFERVFPLGIAALGAAIIGAGTLIIAHNLGNDGDTLQMMQAVLDSNFWLATHVIAITLGYSATFLAGVLGILYLLLGLFTRYLNSDRAKSLVRMIYGVVCFAMLFSFVGTVLGGVWADQSWGRFWGWDPKENGAALVVLINAIILHARWGGIVRDRGIVLLAIGGNIVTAWSWFGVNLLGVGLHSYGFMESGVFWMMAFVTSQFVLIALGLFLRERKAASPAVQY